MDRKDRFGKLKLETERELSQADIKEIREDYHASHVVAAEWGIFLERVKQIRAITLLYGEKW